MLQETARNLVTNCKHGVLSTLSSEGFPYASLVEVAPNAEYDLLLLLSDLAEHSKNIKLNPRASMLLAEDFSALSLAKARACLIGQIQPADQGLLEVYLQHQPQAERYRSFADFKLYHLRIEKTYVVAGFGKMGWLGNLR